MSDTLKVDHETVVVGLGTWTYTVPAPSSYILYGPGMYYISARASEVPVSELSIVINQNGSPIATQVQSLSANSDTQYDVNVNVIANCAIGDILTVVISSSQVNDEQLNTVKTKIIVRKGQ